jgi:chemotaxis protein methyltransferase CheR
MSSSGAAPAPILTEAELKLLQALVYQECGMHFDERRTHFLQDRLLRRLKECRLDSFYSYYRLLISNQGKDELAKLLENLTVNETSFFRHKAQLDLFQKTVLEELFKHKSSRREYSIRVWSAGCSTGQEAYTLAMLVTDALAYYYLRNPLPLDLPLPKPLVPPPCGWKCWPATSAIPCCGRGRTEPIARTRWRWLTTVTVCATSTKPVTAMPSRSL